MRGTALDRISALIEQRQWAAAEASLKRALASDPSNPDLLAPMVHVLTTQGRAQQAEFFARKMLTLMPGDAKALHNLANVLVLAGRPSEAAPLLERALASGPAPWQTHHLLGMALSAQHRQASAVRVLRNALREHPDQPYLLSTHAYVLHGCGRVEEAVPLLRRAAQLAPRDVGIAATTCSIISYAPGVSEEEMLGHYSRYGALLAAEMGRPRTWTPEELRARRKSAEPLRVGLLSPDLRNHAVSFLIEALLEHADRASLMVACYSSAAKEDEVSQRLKGRAALWRSVHGLTAADAAATIERDRIDVLIDLAGHTNGNRMRVLALKPAPVQMTYTGFPNTTGVKGVDYRIVDSITDPPEDESLATERLARLDPCFLSYRPPDDPPPVSPLPCGAAGPVTFAAFSGVLKFNTPMLALWARVLRAVPGSRLMLKHFAFQESEVREDVRSRLVSFGADPALVDITPPEPSARALLPWYHKADIALDTFPYNGTTTFCESFLMGVPMVSLRGRTPPARVGRSLLTAVGLQDLSADHEDRFVEIAATLANDRARLLRIRETLRGTFLGCAICDGARFAQRMGRLCEWAVDQAATGTGGGTAFRSSTD